MALTLPMLVIISDAPLSLSIHWSLGRLWDLDRLFCSIIILTPNERWWPCQLLLKARWSVVKVSFSI
jgi:hypothetical protein